MQLVSSSKDQYAQNCHLFILKCNIKFLDLLVHTETHLHISKCPIGGLININNVIAIMDNCNLSHPRVFQKTATCTVRNSGRINMTALHVTKFRGDHFLYIYRGRFGFIRDTEFVNCSSRISLISVQEQSFLSVDNCSFFSNNNSLVLMENSSLGTIKHSLFKNNKIDSGNNLSFLITGLQSTVLQIILSHFSANSVTKWDRLVACVDKCLAIINNCDFVGNKGGAIVILNSKSLIKNSKFHSNSGVQYGTVALKQDREHQGEKTTIFKQNNMRTQSLALAMHLVLPPVVKTWEISKCVFVNNTTGMGGAIIVKNLSVKLIQCQFVNNSVTQRVPKATKCYGGAVTLIYTAANITKCIFDGNKAHFGGAVAAYGKSLFISSSKFIRNEATQKEDRRGGGIYAELLPKKELYILNSMFEGNRASDIGGAIWVKGTGAFFKTKGCTFQKNSATLGGGILVSTSFGTITNCTFKGNHAETHGGALIAIFAKINITVSMLQLLEQLFMPPTMSLCLVMEPTFSRIEHCRGEFCGHSVFPNEFLFMQCFVSNISTPKYRENVTFDAWDYLCHWYHQETVLWCCDQ